MIGVLAFVGGCALVAFDSAAWFVSQQYVGSFGQGPVTSLVLWYYIVEGFAICAATFGAYFVYKGLRSSQNQAQDSIWTIIAESLSSRRDYRIGVIAAVLYALVYLVVSSMMVYQPGVDFRAAYGVTGPSWNAVGCCGSPGTVPVLIVYLLPQAHLALQVLPLDLLFAVVVPLLVGFNATVAAHALRNRVLRANAGWLGSVGVLAGLFTGCPTCAGLFLAGTIGGLGATGLAVALAPYQVLFVIFSIPVLVASPIIIASNSRRTMRAACPAPGQARAGALALAS